MRRYALRDDPWERIKDLLPGREGHVGVTAKDNRLFVEAVLYRYRAGIPWRDLPERFGAWKKVPTRFGRPRRSTDRRPFRNRIIRLLADDGPRPGSGRGSSSTWQARPTTSTRCSTARSSAPIASRAGDPFA
jgi:transposase